MSYNVSQQESETLLARSLINLAERFEEAASERAIIPSEWLEEHFLIPEPIDIETGEVLPPGPIRLADHQKRIVDEALSKREDGMFKYSTVIYSCPKKSGKSAVAAGVNFFMAATNPYSRTYCLANDGKQANDRIYGPIRDCINLHRKYGGKFQDSPKPKLVELFLHNGTKIEAIPCDAAGEAGSEPLVTTWSEIWAYAGNENKRRLWTEMTVPPTKYGRAIRWVESYAGFTGVSKILEQLYDVATKEGVPHPDFTDLKGRDGEPVVWVNEPARIFCYWDTVPRMVWQNDEYYQEEAAIHEPSEFERVHRNQWSSPGGLFVKEAWWNACRDKSIPDELDTYTPVVLAIDAATENDCAAIVAVTRHHDNPASEVSIRACRIFKALPNQSIILSQTIGKTIQEWGELGWNIVCIAYDAYQMKKLVQDYERGIVEIEPELIEQLSPEELEQYLKEKRDTVERWYYEFGQQKPRAIADKQLQDMVLAGQVHWKPGMLGVDVPDLDYSGETLSQHIKQAGKAVNKNHTRIVKLSETLKVDAAVALSMASERCLALDLDIKLESEESLRNKYLQGQIDHNQYVQAVARSSGVKQ
jgi:hypothetical protein